MNDTLEVLAYHRWGSGGEGDDVIITMKFTVEPKSVQIVPQFPNPVDSCPAEITGDGVVNVSDLLTMIGGWDTPDWDITVDGTTNVSDLLTLIGAFGPCP